LGLLRRHEKTFIVLFATKIFINVMIAGNISPKEKRYAVMNRLDNTSVLIVGRRNK